MLKFLRKTALWILLAPAVIFGAGIASNQLVLTANHDTFPVMWNAYRVFQYRLSLEVQKNGEDEDASMQAQAALIALDSAGMIDDIHCIMTSRTHLNWLADVFDMHDATYSIGDFLLALGEWLWALAPFIWAFEVIRRLRQG